MASPTAARRDELEGTRSHPCWPCRAAAEAAVRTGMAKAPRARPPLGQRSSPQRRRPQREGGGGVRGACPPLTWWPSDEAAADAGGGGGGTVAAAVHGCSRPLRWGRKRYGVAPASRPPAVGGGGGGCSSGGGVGGRVPRCRQCPHGSSGGGGAHEPVLELPCPPAVGGWEKRISPPPPPPAAGSRWPLNN